MQVTVIEIVEKKDGTVDFVKHVEEREYPDTKDRHSDICIMCGFSTYPECREWCHNEKIARDKEAGLI